MRCGTLGGGEPFHFAMMIPQLGQVGVSMSGAAQRGQFMAARLAASPRPFYTNRLNREREGVAEDGFIE